jgi:hypothetical protein
MYMVRSQSSATLQKKVSALQFLALPAAYVERFRPIFASGGSVWRMGRKNEPVPRGKRIATSPSPLMLFNWLGRPGITQHSGRGIPRANEGFAIEVIEGRD